MERRSPFSMASARFNTGHSGKKEKPARPESRPTQRDMCYVLTRLSRRPVASAGGNDEIASPSGFSLHSQLTLAAFFILLLHIPFCPLSALSFVRR